MDVRRKMAAEQSSVQSRLSSEWEKEKKRLEHIISELQRSVMETQDSKQEILSSLSNVRLSLREDLLLWMYKVLEARQSILDN
jgi:predicted RNase H-like nuclease (RuvC/YqgF family)